MEIATPRVGTVRCSTGRAWISIAPAAIRTLLRADRKRFDEARRELFDFESRFDQGRYEKHHLDEDIDHIQRVVNSNSLDPRDRGALAEDLRLMRDYREFRNHHQG